MGKVREEGEEEGWLRELEGIREKEKGEIERRGEGDGRESESM